MTLVPSRLKEVTHTQIKSTLTTLAYTTIANIYRLAATQPKLLTRLTPKSLRALQ